MEHLQNRIFNYVYHRGTDAVDRLDIQLKWEKIKSDMDYALIYMDTHAHECSSIKGDDKVPKCPPKTR
jgi:hypothetical protein